MMTPSVPQFVPELHVLTTVQAGARHANALPTAPAGRTLERVWTVIDEARLRVIGPVHNVSAFLEDHIHDYRVREGKLHYYSRVAETAASVAVVLDYETMGERKTRMEKGAAAPARRATP